MYERVTLEISSDDEKQDLYYFIIYKYNKNREQKSFNNLPEDVLHV